jgi:predicted deacylase
MIEHKGAAYGEQGLPTLLMVVWLTVVGVFAPLAPSHAEQAVATDAKSVQAELTSNSSVNPGTNASLPTAEAARTEPAVPATSSLDVAISPDESAVDAEEGEAAGRSDTAPIVTSPAVAKLPQAKSVELNEPVVGPTIVDQENLLAPVVEGLPETAAESSEGQLQLDLAAGSEPLKPLIILGTEVLPSTSTRLSWSPSQSFEGIATPTPVLIVNGARKGPVLCLTAALHGDELNGIEIVRRVLYNLVPADLVGSVVGVPIVNLQGFRRSSRYLTDRRDLNRYFPGNPLGSSASRIAYSFFTEVISHCDALVDIHTGSFYRTNLPQLRADVSNPQVVKLAQNFGSTVVLNSGGAVGTLRRAAVEAGIPAVTLEAGESMSLQVEAVDHGVKGIRTMMNQLGMTQKFSLWGDPEPVYYQSIWVRADLGGILFSEVELGDKVKKGELLGVVTDPITNIKHDLLASRAGRVIGMALNQVVLPGFAAFHIGIHTPTEKIPAAEDIDQPDHTALILPDEELPEEDTQTLEAELPAVTVVAENHHADPQAPGEEIDQEDLVAPPTRADDYD